MIDLTREPLGETPDGEDVFLKDIWPTHEEIAELVEQTVTRGNFREVRRRLQGRRKWQSVETTDSETYDWPPTSTYIQNPPYFQGMSKDPERHLRHLRRAHPRPPRRHGDDRPHLARRLVQADHPGGKYLTERQIRPDFNSYGSRRGTPVMVRGTFANIRIRNEMLDGVEGDYTLGPDGSETSIFDASMAYQAAGVPLVVIGGVEYGALVARLGGEGHGAARGQGGDRRELRADPPLEPRRRGVIPFEFTNGETASPWGSGRRDHLDLGARRRPEAALDRALHDRLRRRARADHRAQVPHRYRGRDRVPGAGPALRLPQPRQAA